jgi:O-antigen/teichoic acid export membrane protein
MTSALQRTVPQAADERAATHSVRAALVLGVTPCLFAAIAAFFGAPWLAAQLNVAAADRDLLVPAIQLFVWALPLWALVEIMTSALRARHLFGAEIRLRIFWEQLIRLALAALFYFAGLGIMGLFLAHLISLAITVLLSLRLAARHFPLRDLFAPARTLPEWQTTLGAGLSVLPANIAARLFGDAPPLLLNLMIPGAGGASAAALFVIVRKLSSVVQLVRTAFAYVLAPVASLARRHDMAHVAELYGFATRLATTAVIPLAGVMAGGADALLRLFGREAMVALAPLTLMLIARGAEATLGAALPIAQVTLPYRRQLTGSMLGLIAALAVGTMLVPAAPLSGMCAAVATGFLVGALVPVIQLWRIEQLHPFESGWARALVAALLIGMAVGGAVWLAAPAALWPALAVTLGAALAAVWLAMRLGLGAPDRAALGRAATILRLV